MREWPTEHVEERAVELMDEIDRVLEARRMDLLYADRASHGDYVSGPLLIVEHAEQRRIRRDREWCSAWRGATPRAK